MLKTAFEKVLGRSGEDGYFRFRIPAVLSAPGGLLFAMEARCENKGDWGNIDIQVLISDGENIRKVLLIGDGRNGAAGEMHTYNNPVLVPDGERVHLLYCLNYERMFIRTSADGGVTWGEEREITRYIRAFDFDWNVCAVGPGHGVKMKNGRLAAAVWLADGKAHGMIRDHFPSVAGVMYSDDGGETWQCGGIASGMKNASETTVAELSDGRLLVNFRNENENRRRVLAYSDNGGRTLTGIHSHPALTDPVCFGSMVSEGDNVWFINCDNEKGRKNLTVRLSEDGGDTWQSVWHVDDMGGYADLAVKGKSLHAFYERTYEDGTWELVWKRADM